MGSSKYIINQCFDYGVSDHILSDYALRYQPMHIGTPKVAAVRVLETCDVVSPNPVMESCCLLIASLLPQSQEELPQSEKHPVRMIVEKLVHFRLEFLLDDDSKNFKPEVWWESIMKTEFEFELKDMHKLNKSIGEYLKNMPKSTLGTYELISNDYADYGLQDTHQCILVCFYVLITDYARMTDYIRITNSYGL